jgi:hypothetical protein
MNELLTTEIEELVRDFGQGRSLPFRLRLERLVQIAQAVEATKYEETVLEQGEVVR